MERRCLIVANQTLGGDALDRAIKSCLSRDISTFVIVVPVTPVHDEEASWAGGFALHDDSAWIDAESARQAMEADARQREAEFAEAKIRAQHRLRLMMQKIVLVGGEASGEVAINEPVDAARAVLENDADFQEIIVSTLPSRFSRWLRLDLPNRIARITDIPVVTVEADD